MGRARGKIHVIRSGRREWNKERERERSGWLSSGLVVMGGRRTKRINVAPLRRIIFVLREPRTALVSRSSPLPHNNCPDSAPFHSPHPSFCFDSLRPAGQVYRGWGVSRSDELVVAADRRVDDVRPRAGARPEDRRRPG